LKNRDEAKMIKIKTQKKLMFVPALNVLIIFFCYLKNAPETWDMAVCFGLIKRGMLYGGIPLLMVIDVNLFNIPDFIFGISAYSSMVWACHYFINIQIKQGIE